MPLLNPYRNDIPSALWKMKLNALEDKNKMVIENNLKKKLINASKLKIIFRDILNVFEKHKLNAGEIEFVISDLGKLSDLYSLN